MGEELARQSENALRLAKQRHECARKRLEEEQALQLEEMSKENRRKLAEATITELELTELLSEAPDEFHEVMSRISKHSRQTPSQRVSDWVNDVNSAPPQVVTTESNRIGESSNPPISTTTTIKVVQGGLPNQLAALAPGLNSSPIAQAPNVAAVNFHMPVTSYSSPPSLAVFNQLPLLQMSAAVAPTTLINAPHTSQTQSVPPHTQPPVKPRYDATSD